MSDLTPVDHIGYWYNRSERAWVIQALSVEGYQVGASEYIGSGKEDALEVAAEMAADNGNVNIIKL